VSNPAGLAIPLPWDWGAQYVDGGPFTSFSKNFYVDQAIYYSILELEVLTAYEDFAASAVVLVNNQQVGTVEPRPLSRYQDLQSYSVFFSNGTLSGSAPHTGWNNLKINPVSQFDWLVVARWRIHYQRSF
jgi:hypothetical protein